MKNDGTSGDTLIVYSQVTGYTIEISGGNCLKDDPVQVNTTGTEYHLQPDSECHRSIDADNRFHSGANYTIRIKALNHNTNIASNFSDPKWISTQPRGIISITSRTYHVKISSLQHRVVCHKISLLDEWEYPQWLCFGAEYNATNKMA